MDALDREGENWPGSARQGFTNHGKFILDYRAGVWLNVHRGTRSEASNVTMPFSACAATVCGHGELTCGDQMMENTEMPRVIAASMWQALGGEPAAIDELRFTGDGDLPSTYPVTDLAAASIGVAALAVAELMTKQAATVPVVSVDRRLASFWFGFSIRPIGWQLAPAWDPIAGDYQARDGWIRLHTNAPHHRSAAQKVLGAHNEEASMAAAVHRWSKRDLESAVVAAGGCAAEMRSSSEWAEHPQGRAVAAEPLVGLTTTAQGRAALQLQNNVRPLEGLRVLDLTRVLAGPVASRFLAGYGAEVLRIDPPDWNEDGVIPEVTLGKRCAALNIKSADGRAKFEALLSRAHVLLHGYRPDALDRLGYDAATRQVISPGLIDVALSAYGWSGPWAGRRGFDSLVQMSVGIADAGMRSAGAAKPTPLPVQALDQATGYLMAAAAVRGVVRRIQQTAGTSARLSLARTAKLLADCGQGTPSSELLIESAHDLSDAIEATDWGPARRLRPPASIDGAPMGWANPATRLRSVGASWLTESQ